MRLGTPMVPPLSTAGTITMEWQVWTIRPAIGATLLVLAGPGAGQSRVITAVPSSTTMVLESPLNGWVEAHISLLTVVGSFGQKTIAGNRFVWGEVTQFYGNTIRGVFADNSLAKIFVILLPPAV